MAVNFASAKAPLRAWRRAGGPSRTGLHAVKSCRAFAGRASL